MLRTRGDNQPNAEPSLMSSSSFSSLMTPFREFGTYDSLESSTAASPQPGMSQVQTPEAPPRIPLDEKPVPPWRRPRVPKQQQEPQPQPQPQPQPEDCPKVAPEKKPWKKQRQEEQDQPPKRAQEPPEQQPAAEEETMGDEEGNEEELIEETTEEQCAKLHWTQQLRVRIETAQREASARARAASKGDRSQQDFHEKAQQQQQQQQQQLAQQGQQRPQQQ